MGFWLYPGLYPTPAVLFYRALHAAGKHIIISKRYGGNLFPGINRSCTKTDISGFDRRSLRFRSFVDMAKKTRSRVRVSEEDNDGGGGEHKEEPKSNLYEVNSTLLN